MRWYLLTTWVNQEEELVKEIRRIVPSYLYDECFVIYQERIWRKQQRSIVHAEPLFPGCVFLTCQEAEQNGENDSLCPQPTVRRIERIPEISRRIACGSLTILPMMREDAEFLDRIGGKEHIVRLSYVLKDEDGNICKLSEPLNLCRGQIERFQFKKRYAMVRHRLWGEERMIVLGIVLKEDAERKLLYESTYQADFLPENRMNDFEVNVLTENRMNNFEVNVSAENRMNDFKVNVSSENRINDFRTNVPAKNRENDFKVKVTAEEMATG